MGGQSHTAGPWSGRVQYGRLCDEIQAGGRAVAAVWVRREVGVTMEHRQLVVDREGEANFRLIAAAPDHALIAMGFVHGARWDSSPSEGQRGEFCFLGLCHSTVLDEFGVPVMTGAMRRILTAKATGESAA